MKNVRFAVKKALHPRYTSDALYWAKWRSVYEGGQPFINKYLQRFSKRETTSDYNIRKKITYAPAFAKAAIVDIRNSIYQRMCEVQRVGPTDYMDTFSGKNGGVDKCGRSIANYLGTVVLDELLTMARVAIWVDNICEGSTKLTKSQPYLTMFKVEDIRAWDDLQNPTSILLRETVLASEHHGLVTSECTRYRLAKEVTFEDLTEAQIESLDVQAFQGTRVYVEIFEDDDTLDSQFLLDLPKIPVVVMQISQSLLKDVAEYQIALLNLASSDMSYVLKSNFPFYTEQYAPGTEFMQNAMSNADAAKTGTTDDEALKSNSAAVGVTTGRRYSKGMERPQFIAPPTEPLKVSMEKQEQLKREIRLLVNLSLSNISPTRSSRESKDHDNQALESGLSYIAQELERAENLIAAFWVEYLGTGTPTSVTYPDHYSLKSDEQLLKEANDDLDLVPRIPSKTAQRALIQRAVGKALRSSVDASGLKSIHAELDGAEVLISTAASLREDVELGLVSVDTASKALQYPVGEAAKAKGERVERLAATAIAQSKASAVKIVEGNANKETADVGSGD